MAYRYSQAIDLLMKSLSEGSRSNVCQISKNHDLLALNLRDTW